MCILHEDVGHIDLFMYVKRSDPLESTAIYVPLPSRAYKIRDKQYMWDQADIHNSLSSSSYDSLMRRYMDGGG